MSKELEDVTATCAEESRQRQKLQSELRALQADLDQTRSHYEDGQEQLTELQARKCFV